MNKLISFGIPTYERAEMLEEALDYYYNVLNLGAYELLISDNASSDNTSEIVSRFSQRYNNITYFRQKKNIGADCNFLFLQDQCKTDYFLVLGDGVRFRKEFIELLLKELATGDYDIIGFDYNNRSKGRYETAEYTDSNKVLSEVAWYLTQLSSYVLSKKVIENTKTFRTIYEGCEFNYYIRIFEFMARNSFRLKWLNVDSMFFSSIPKHNTWTKRKAKVWFSEFVNSILSLPPIYSIDSKFFCLMEAASYPMFSNEVLLNDIYCGNITNDALIENANGIKIMLGDEKYKEYIEFSRLSGKQQLKIIKRSKRPRNFREFRIKLAIGTRLKKLLYI